MLGQKLVSDTAKVYPSASLTSAALQNLPLGQNLPLPERLPTLSKSMDAVNLPSAPPSSYGVQNNGEEILDRKSNQNDRTFSQSDDQDDKADAFGPNRDLLPSQVQSDSYSQASNLLIQSVDATDSKTFEGIPKEWHETIRVRNPDTQRVKLFFKCRHPGCNSMFKKSCNLRDHFRKHTGQRPFSCPKC